MSIGTVLHVLSGIPAVVGAITDAVSSIKKGIYTVKVAKPADEKVKSDLNNLGIESFSEMFKTMSLTGVEREDMTKVLDRIAMDCNGLDYEMRLQMNGYIFGNRSEFSVFEVKFTTESKKKATYVMIVFQKTNDGRYNCKSVSCTVEFKIAQEKPEELEKEILFGIFTQKVTVGGKDGDHVNPEVIEELENFIRYLVVKKLKDI